MNLQAACPAADPDDTRESKARTTAV